MGLYATLKDPAAVRDYQFDWSLWLVADTIATSVWTVPAGLTLDSDSNTTTTATAWLSGGTVGAVYEVVNTITTAGGQTEERTIRVSMINR